MAKKAAKQNSRLIGRWRITWMDQWDQDYVNAEVEGYFEFRPGGVGDFQFGYVRGEMNYREGTRGAQPCSHFTWDGHDEIDPAQGRGWAILSGNEIDGMIFFQSGDGSAFRATRAGR